MTLQNPLYQRPDRFDRLRERCLNRITEFQASAKLFLTRYNNVVAKVGIESQNIDEKIYKAISMRLTNNSAERSLNGLISNLDEYRKRLKKYVDENVTVARDMQKLYVVVQCVNALRYEFDEPLRLVAQRFGELYTIVENSTFKNITFMVPYNMILRKDIKEDIKEGRKEERRSDRIQANPSEFQIVNTVLTDFGTPPDQETLPDKFKTIQGWYNDPRRFDKRPLALPYTTRKNNIQVVEKLASAWSVLDLLSKEQTFFKDKFERAIGSQTPAFGEVRTASQTTTGGPLRPQWTAFENGKSWIPWILGHDADWYRSESAPEVSGEIIQNFQRFHSRGLIARWFFAFADITDADRVKLVDHYLLLLKHMMDSQKSIDPVIPRAVQWVINLTTSKLLEPFEADPPFTKFNLTIFEGKKSTFAGFVDEV